VVLRFFWFNHQQLFGQSWGDKAGSPVEEYLRDKFLCEQAHNFGDDYSGKKRSRAVVKNWDPSKVSIVTTCKNRWDFLKESLSTWLNRGFAEVVIVDWSSETSVSSQIEKMPHGQNLVSVIRVDGEDIFNAGMARNTGARQLLNEYLLFIDSDMVIKNWDLTSGISLVPGRFYHGPHNIPPFGTSLVRAADFRAVNGYSELYTAYGWEDNDLYNRLETNGLQRCLYDDRIVEHKDHDDELRSQHRDQKGRKLHETVWDNRKIEAWTPTHKQAEKTFSKRVFLV
jgi:glycosyltransferase involved in cell wall biosynthesis